MIYIGSMACAMAKYAARARASTKVVIKGLAITAGSKPSRFAAMGSRHPIDFASATTKRSVSEMTAAI